MARLIDLPTWLLELRGSLELLHSLSDLTVFKENINAQEGMLVFVQSQTSDDCVECILYKDIESVMDDFGDRCEAVILIRDMKTKTFKKIEIAPVVTEIDSDVACNIMLGKI